MTSSPNAIRTDNLTYFIKKKCLLHSVSFSVNYGEVVGLVGPNGCGKSTLIKAISGSFTNYQGEILIADHNLAQLTTLKAAQLRAVVSQESEMNFDFTVQEVIDMSRFPWQQKSGALQNSDQNHIIEKLELSHLLSRSYISLSGGEKQRVNFARALSQNTKILLLDEPTAAMDISFQEKLMLNLRAEAKQNLAILVVLHDLSLAAAYCDRVLLMQNGSIIAQGTAKTVLTEANLSKTYAHPIQVNTDPVTQKLIIFPKRI